MKKRKSYKRKKSRKLKYWYIAVVIIFLSLFIYFSLHSSNPATELDTNQAFFFKAAIVDHLSLFEPNQTFIETATTILEEAGFTVDYYPGEEVTVEFFRNLSTHDYGLIVLRVHSAATPPLALFTSEIYSKIKYEYEQLTGQVAMASIYKETEPFYFGVTPKFVKESMKGNFPNTIIIMMGCDGLKYDGMAEAFIEKGARTYISWDKGVLASHTDRAIIHLLRRLVIEKQTIEKAVTETMKEVGPDPELGSILLYYPDSVDNYVIPNSASNLILNDATVSGYDPESSLRHVHCSTCGVKLRSV